MRVFDKLLLGTAALALVMGSTLSVSRMAAESDFDRLLRLAYIADAQYDALPDDWEAVQPRDWFEFQYLAKTIIAQFPEEGVSRGVYPRDVGFTEYGFIRRSMVAGTYSPELNIVALNARYIADPRWQEFNYQSVLVHELVHAQGYHNEAQTETLATEVMAAFANLGQPGYLREFWDDMRRTALSVAFYMAYYDAPLLHTSEPGEFGGLCIANCIYVANEKRMVELQAAREAIFTPDELRRSDKRLRFWLAPEFGNRFLWVLAQYSVKVLTPILDVACEGDYPRLNERFYREVEVQVAGQFITVKQIQERFQVDDIHYLLAEAGFC